MLKETTPAKVHEGDDSLLLKEMGFSSHRGGEKFQMNQWATPSRGKQVLEAPSPETGLQVKVHLRVSVCEMDVEEQGLQPLVFGFFLSMYLIAVLGNLLIILAYSSDSHLHTPMYFFLANLSFVDICFTSTTVPKMLWNIWTQSKVITYAGCITQLFFFIFWAGLDVFLLTVMAYDRFVAICHPLYYMVIMNPRLCGLLVLGSWVLSTLNSLLQSLILSRVMDPENDTGISEFLLMGFSEEPQLQPLIFGTFLSMYLITVFGNLLIILAISSDSQLHTPMYFFLANLSFVDICFTSTTVPKMLWNILTQNKVITYADCITQMFFFTLFGGLDMFLLTVMAYDHRFVAICHPLHYMVIMNPRLCGLLVLVSWVLSALHSLLESLMVLLLSFSRVLEIPQFFCELNQMIQLACSDTFLNNMVLYFGAMLLAGGPFIGIICSYFKIVSSICGISSAQGKYKAFSTCASHLSVVSLFCCTSLGVYLSSATTQSSHSSATASVMYTVVTPMLNPFIYSLRNKGIKEALRRLFGMVATKGPILLG
ncbi:olfactory receptor 7A17-like [Suricata suricatta]|uniref:olfactory receptor 7A17-like n=1 Tax=Suricata suricatta TaxID=37032 RepID=UPI0011559029|nr:olfactory receptor 7A17-like [Suricata suricatta]